MVSVPHNLPQLPAFTSHTEMIHTAATAESYSGFKEALPPIARPLAFKWLLIKHFVHRILYYFSVVRPNCRKTGVQGLYKAFFPFLVADTNAHLCMHTLC